MAKDQPAEAKADRTAAEPHYEFGANWSRFAAQVDQGRGDAATAELQRLLGELGGKSFLDIGCGSGLHSLAALRLGAARVTAFDYDPQSVATAAELLAALAPGKPWRVEQGDILAPGRTGEAYDVVYSWGVLHHTGAMWRAIENAADLVGSGGTLALALYVKTPCCGFWKREKRFYTRHKSWRPVLDLGFSALLLLRKLLAGQNPWRYVAEYRSLRGMDFCTDVRDWLGGHPYESVTGAELVAFLKARGFALSSARNTSPGLGVFGAACGEWTFVKI
jgi:2-polyprenyl-6-hydroxyphenyl methylase/3-demethylubiquinone-9 3-methyltransferase